MNKEHIFLSNGRVHIKEISGNLNSGRMVVRIAPAKIPCSARVASHHPAFMGNCPTINHMFLALSTYWVSFLSRE